MACVTAKRPEFLEKNNKLYKSFPLFLIIKMVNEEVRKIKQENKHLYLKLILVLIGIAIILLVAVISYYAFKSQAEDFVNDKTNSLDAIPTTGVCGDGDCNNNELEDNNCPEDCGEIDAVEVGTCGDGFCDNHELINKTCPEDCG